MTFERPLPPKPVCDSVFSNSRYPACCSEDTPPGAHWDVREAAAGVQKDTGALVEQRSSTVVSLKTPGSTFPYCTLDTSCGLGTFRSSQRQLRFSRTTGSSASLWTERGVPLMPKRTPAAGCTCTPSAAAHGVTVCLRLSWINSGCCLRQGGGAAPRLRRVAYNKEKSFNRQQTQ